MADLRKYGSPPFKTVVIHGGPGAPGEMKPVAEKLAEERGILEPLQTKTSIQGQLQELHKTLQQHSNLPVILIGYSWGAWLSYIFAAHYPLLVKKIILVSSGPFQEEYTTGIMETRLSRINEKEKKEANSIIKKLSDSNAENEEKLLSRFGQLMAKADSYAPVNTVNESADLEVQLAVYQKVWQEASNLRRNGQLLKLGSQVQCPVVAIHGDYDPHPYQGVKEPLEKIIKDFKFVLLNNCGHTPWLERKVKDKFYKIIEQEIKSGVEK